MTARFPVHYAPAVSTDPIADGLHCARLATSAGHADVAEQIIHDLHREFGSQAVKAADDEAGA